MSGAEKFEVEGDMYAGARRQERERERSRNCLTEWGVKYGDAALYISGKRQRGMWGNFCISTSRFHNNEQPRRRRRWQRRQGRASI